MLIDVHLIEFHIICTLEKKIILRGVIWKSKKFEHAFLEIIAQKLISSALA